MRSLLLLLLSLLGIWSQGCSSSLPSPPLKSSATSAVLLAQAPSPFKAEAWFHASQGLLLLPLLSSLNQTSLSSLEFSSLLSSLPSAPLSLGDSSLPGFHDNGDLYFLRSLDNGREPELEEDWFLPYHHKKPRPVPIGEEGVPEVVTERRDSLLRHNLLLLLQQSKRAFSIVIDPSGGGGARVVALRLALELKELLLGDRGLWRVMIVGGEDQEEEKEGGHGGPFSLRTRVGLANGWPADVFLVLRGDLAQGDATSLQEGTPSSKLRDLLQEQKAKLQPGGTSKTENLFLLREAIMPAVISSTGAAPTSLLAQAHLAALQAFFAVPPVSDS